MSSNGMNGFLCVDKIAGITSRAVVNMVHRHVRPDKVGHAGTLDPLATGVLVIAVGRSTKLISYVQRMPKTYLAEFELGKTSDTEDITGKIQAREVATLPSEEAVREACRQFEGEIMQLPPQFSALKVDGRRAYDLARTGKEVQLAPRPIRIYEASVVEYAYPLLRLNVQCGSGTYIRSLGRDIGEELGCGAVMSSLRRTRIGGFHLDRSVSSDELQLKETVRGNLQPPLDGVDLQQRVLEPDQMRDIEFGRPIKVDASDEEFVAVTSDGQFIAVLNRDKERWYKAVVNFSAK